MTWLSKKKRAGGAERIADAAILAGDVLIERFIGCAGGGHIKEQWLIRIPLPLFIYSILKSYLFLFIYLVPVKWAELKKDWLFLQFPFIVSCCGKKPLADC